MCERGLIQALIERKVMITEQEAKAQAAESVTDFADSLFREILADMQEEETGIHIEITVDSIEASTACVWLKNVKVVIDIGG